MDSTQGTPYQPQNQHEVSEMLRGLEANTGKGKGKGGFSVKKATFEVKGSKALVDSWRMQDWDYKKPNLPTYARGIFTTQTSHGNPEIVIRGYDKFFNRGEVRSTEWQEVNSNTRGPYELSVKENGCIIFISGLEDGTLLVCSKHSIASSHAETGEKWVERHLSGVGRTKTHLAMKLREMNATAVAELCDDEFEEHVLAYEPETAGLYLHGINLNLPEFATYPHHLVDQFAEEWGFKKTQYIIKQDIAEVKTFLDGVAETGHYAGRDTEGFVIRCQSKADTGRWHDWFFKYKFDEPYLMYRQWRECTKAIIAQKEPKFKKHKKITEDYLTFARKQLHNNPDLAKAYNQNHGIIKMRDDFLASRGLRGYDIIRQEAEDGDVSNDTVDKDVVLVPVATIGCGKTTVALALCELFQWGHVQNDNITVQRQKAAAFAHACTDALTRSPAMVADRNNHQKRERKQLITDVSKIVPAARFVALHYLHDRRDYIRQVTRARVLERGDNHQTIQVATKGADDVIGIMEGFLKRFEPVDVQTAPDDDFDLVVDLDPCASSRANLDTVVNRLYVEYPKLFAGREMPTADDMDAALEAALRDYTVDIKHEIKSRQSSKTKPAKPPTPSNGLSAPRARPLEYFAIHLPPPRFRSRLASLFDSADPATAKMYHHLLATGRLQTTFHVTLIHRANAGQYAAEWARLTEMNARRVAEQPQQQSQSQPQQDPTPVLGHCNVRLERLVWDGRVMAFVVRLVPNAREGGAQVWSSTNVTPHVTVGTAGPGIKPVESNAMLERWLREGSTMGPVGAQGQEGVEVRELKVPGNVELEGRVMGVLSMR